MSLTFGKAKEILKPFCGKSGKTTASSDLDLFVIKTLQYLLYTGSPGAEKLFEFYTSNGYFTAPYELETPLKVKVNGRIGNAVNKWFEFRSGTDVSLKDTHNASDTLYEDGNDYFTAFDIPSGGAQVGVMGTVQEQGAYLIVSGDDTSGREVYTNHKGAKISGEVLEIEKGVIHWSNVTFDTIVGIVKTPTNGYTPFYWRNAFGITGFLSDYSPIEEVPNYRRFKIEIPDCPDRAKITVLGRVRLKSRYADNDRIPFDNIYAIEVAGQQVQSQSGGQLEAATQGDTFLQTLVGRESVHKKQNNGTPIEVYKHTSGGTIKGLVK